MRERLSRPLLPLPPFFFPPSSTPAREVAFLLPSLTFLRRREPRVFLSASSTLPQLSPSPSSRSRNPPPRPGLSLASPRDDIRCSRRESRFRIQPPLRSLFFSLRSFFAHDCTARCSCHAVVVFYITPSLLNEQMSTSLTILTARLDHLR